MHPSNGRRAERPALLRWDGDRAAQEELGKALWIYDTFADAWNNGEEDALTVDRLAADGRSHVIKYLEAAYFGDELPTFWGDYSNVDQRQPGESWDQMVIRQAGEAREAARLSNTAKQRGFYVDRDEHGRIYSPTDASTEGVDDELRRAAQVVEMLLIRDHTRMKHEASTPYDSTHPQQFRLLPISHPEEFAASPLSATQARPEEEGGRS